MELARANGDPPAARAAVSEALSSASGHIIAFCSEATAFAVALEADCALDGLAVAPGTIDIVDGWIATLQSCLDEAPGRWRIEDLGMFRLANLAGRSIRRPRNVLQAKL